MKRLILLSMLMSAGLSFSSCNDELDLKSDGSITMDDVFNDRNRTRGYLNACYDYVGSVSLSEASYTSDAHDSQDVIAGSAFDYWYNTGLTAETWQDMISSPWSNCYYGIRRCNVFIANIDASTAYASDSEKSGWKAQAKVLRAYYYLQLIKCYGQVPLLIESRSSDYDYSADEKASVGEIVAQILKDCDEALATEESSDFPWGIQNGQWGIMNRAMAYMIKSEAITFAVSPLYDDGTYTTAQAVDITKEALSQCLSHDYSLFTETDGMHNAYAYYFLYNPNDLRAKDKETIYGGTQVAAWSSAGLPTTDGMSVAGPCPTQDLVDAYEMANGQTPITGYYDSDHLNPIVNTASGYSENNPYEGRDPRFYATVYYNGALRYLDGRTQTVSTYVGGDEGISETSNKSTRTGYYLHKFAHFNSTKLSNSDGYIRMYRLPELYYNFAEAAYQAYGPDEKISMSNGMTMSACDAVNTVRARAGMPGFSSGMSKEQFQTKYRNERRIEFAMERMRYFDVRRWKILSETDKFVTGMRIEKNADGSYTYNRFRFSDRPTSADKYLLYPLDVTEASKMEKLTGQVWQNPGW